MDILWVSFYARILAVLFGLVGIIVILAGGWLIGGGIVLYNLLCFAIGWGMSRYHMWAWYAGTFFLAPMFLLLSLLSLSLHIIFVAIGILTSIWFFWVMLSRGGRKRYRQLSQTMREIRERPGSLAARVHGKAKKRERQEDRTRRE